MSIGNVVWSTVILLQGLVAIMVQSEILALVMIGSAIVWRGWVENG